MSDAMNELWAAWGIQTIYEVRDILSDTILIRCDSYKDAERVWDDDRVGRALVAMPLGTAVSVGWRFKNEPLYAAGFEDGYSRAVSDLPFAEQQRRLGVVIQRLDVQQPSDKAPPVPRELCEQIRAEAQRLRKSAES